MQSTITLWRSGGGALVAFTEREKTKKSVFSSSVLRGGENSITVCFNEINTSVTGTDKNCMVFFHYY